MKKLYIICRKHPDLRFKDDKEFYEHVMNAHEGDIDDFLEAVRHEAVESVMEDLVEEKEIQIDLDDPELDEDLKAIDFDKIEEDVRRGKQRVIVE